MAVPPIMALGFQGALARRSALAPVHALGWAYTTMVRGIPDIVFFLFVPIALDQGIEWARHQVLCPGVDAPVWRGNDFVVCAAAKMPVSAAAPWVHDAYGFLLAPIAYSVVFGAFAANVLVGAMRAVPRGQLEAGAAIRMSRLQVLRRIHLPQMWVYALPGLSNLWMILIKAPPLLFLLGVEDIVYWARGLGGMKTRAFDYLHPDWRVWYFAALLVFYLGLTSISEIGFGRLTQLVGRGQALYGTRA
jgi:polar amino acid transport system permease protein